jgi:hypothetical protein
LTEVVVGGVGQLWQGDLDLGRVAAQRLSGEDLGRGVLVEDLYYGAVAVAQRLQDLAPSALVLVGAEAAGRPAGSVRRIRVDPARYGHDPGAVADAVQGYVSMHLLLEVAASMGALPQRTVQIVVEPTTIDTSTTLTAPAETALEGALGLVRAEVRRIPLLALADEIRSSIDDGHIEPCAGLDALRALLVELQTLDREGRWGRAFAERDRLRQSIAASPTGEGMTHMDWGMWWTLVEELDRLQPLEAT